MGSLTRRFVGGDHTGVCVRLVYEPETRTPDMVRTFS